MTTHDWGWVKVKNGLNWVQMGVGWIRMGAVGSEARGTGKQGKQRHRWSRRQDMLGTL